MKNPRQQFILLALSLGLMLGAVAAPAQSTNLTVTKVVDASRLLPISLAGFTGEVGTVLRFDLEVAGFTVVAPAQAQFEVTGSNTDRVEARLAVRGQGARYLLAKAYTGGSLRLQAHALADDIVLAVTGKRGIAQTRIAYKVNFGRSGEIFISDYDGFNAVPVTRDQSIVAAPCWGAGQRSLFYTSYKMGWPDIFAHDLTTGARNVVSRHPGLNTSAAISPDGRRMAMVLSKSGNPDIYVADIDGRNLRQLSNGRDSASSPCWSPDGQMICFSSRVSGPSRLFVVSANGGEPRRIATDGAPNATEPDWSPDGQTIVFTSQMGGFQICTVPAAGGGATVLCAGEDPSWAANSRTVIFAKRRANQTYFLSLLDVPTKQVKDVPQNSGNYSQPAWAK